MTETTHKFTQIFNDLITSNNCEMGRVNIQQLTSHLEELYLENQELKQRVETLETKMFKLWQQDIDAFESEYD